MARYISLYSGSSGNCSVVEEGGKFILIDMGKSAKLTAGCLKELGLEMKNLMGILVSHEHTDHIAGLKVFLKNTDVPLYTGAATADFLTDRMLVPGHIQIEDLNFARAQIGPFQVYGFDTPHDSVGCLGFRIHTEGGSSISIATDLGFVSQGIFDNLRGVDLAVVESNYDEKMLREGPYPYYLKTRISSNSGHLSNRQSSYTALRLIEGGVGKIQLCHLSNNNNTHRLALGAIDSTAASLGIKIDGNVQIKVNSRHSITPPTEF